MRTETFHQAREYQRKHPQPSLNRTSTIGHRALAGLRSPPLLPHHAVTDPIASCLAAAETDSADDEVTILGLNRPKLQEERQYVLNTLGRLCTVARHPDSPDTIRREAREAMNSFARPDARYSAMVRDYLSVVDAETENENET